jgi:membrane associated rhomboid family serine protease
MATIDSGTVISLIIVALILGGLIYGLIRKLSMTLTLAIVNFIIFMLWRFSTEGISPDIANTVGDLLGIRYVYFSDEPIKLYTLFTHMYLHFDFLHILGNMIFLVLFGLPFEERIGPKAFAAIFFTSGVIASTIDAGFSLNIYSTELGQMLGTDPIINHIGASGAIFGMMGGFLALYPHDKVFAPVGFIIMRVPVWVGVLIYAIIETFLAVANPDDSIGHMVHIMGFFSGYFMAMSFAKYIKSDERASREAVMDLDELKKLAATNELHELFLKFEKEDEPDIRRAWLEKFVESAKCPKCKSKLELKGRRIKCNCGYNIRF